MMKYIIFLFLSIALYQIAEAQILPAKLSRKMGMYPVIFLDSGYAGIVPGPCFH
jgi:hypothetical protein